MEFIQNDWYQRDIIKRIRTINKQGIPQSQYSNMTNDITYIYIYIIGLDQPVKWCISLKNIEVSVTQEIKLKY